MHSLTSTAKHLIIILFISLIAHSTSAQIQFQNPSFEAGGSPPTGWPFCNGSTDVEPGVFTSTAPSNGTRYLGFWDGGATNYTGIAPALGEGTMQKLVQFGQDCPLVVGKTYTFQVDVIANPNVNTTIILPPYDPGVIAFIGGFAQCTPSKLFWRSDAAYVVPAVGRTWHRYTITFTADKAYSWVGFYAINRSGGEQISIDNLSTITKIDGTVSSVNATCAAGGSIKFNPAAGATGPFTFTWSQGGTTLPETGDELTDLSPGTYELEVIDNSESCPVPSYFTTTITGTLPITGNLTLDKNTLCEGETAQLGFNNTGAARPLNYNWTPATGLGTTNAASTSAAPTQNTTYTLTVSDPSDPSCELVLDTTINYIEINAGLPNTVDACNDDGTLDLNNELGGTPDLGGTWKKPDGSAFNGTVDFATDASGDYTYTVSHATCPSESAIVGVTITELKDPGLDGSTIVCNSDQQINIFNLLGGTPDVGGSWTPNPFSGFNATTEVFNPNHYPSGKYPFDYTIAADGACPEVSAQVEVEIEEIPAIDVEPIEPVCEGNQAEIIYSTSAGKAPFTIVIKEDGSDLTFNNQTKNGSIFLTPKKGSTYTLTTVTSSATNACQLDTSIVLNFSFFTAPVVSLDSAFCDANNVTYQVAMTLANGDPASYELNGDINVSNKTKYVTDPISSGNTYSFTIKDDNGCLPESTISGVYSCGCATIVGTQTYTGDTITVCETSSATVVHNGDEFLDPNDALSFVLHNSKGSSLGNVFAHNVTGEFFFDASVLSYDIVYYISAVAGDANGSLTDLTNPNGCMEVSPGQPIIFRQNPDITFADINTNVCPSDNSVWEITTTSGRLPLQLSDDAGNSYNITSSPENISQPIYQDTSINLSSVTDAYGCSSTFAPQNILQGQVLDSIFITNYTFTCNATNTGFVAEFDIVGGDATSYNLINSNITGVLDAAGHYVSDELSNGFIINLSAEDGNSCNTPTLSETGLCPCSTVSGEMDYASNNAPLEFCIENLATVNFRDNNNDGTIDGYQPDGNDIQSYILLQNLADTAIVPYPNFIALNSTPSFAFDAASMNTNTVYYIVPVAGDNDGNGLVDFTNGCRDYADGTPIIFNEPSTITFTTPQEVCLGDVIPVTINITSTSQLTFTLAANNGYSQTFTYGTGTQTIDIPNTTTGNVVVSIDTIGSAFVDLTNPTACRARWISAPSTVGIVDLPTAAFAGKLDNTICEGETINAGLLLTGNGSFNVDLLSGENFTATGVSNTYNNAYSFTPADSAQYELNTISVTSALGLTCNGSVDLTPYIVNVNSIDEANIGYSNGPICADNNSTLLVDIDGDNPIFNFYMTTPLGSIQNEQTTGFSYSEVRNNLQQTETFTLDSVFDNTISDASGKACVFYPINITATLFVNPLPTGVISLSGDDVLCVGEGSDYTVTFTGSPDFTATVIDGNGNNTVINSSSYIYTESVTPSQNSNYTITSLSDGNGCVATNISGTANIEVKSLPAISIIPSQRDTCVALNVDFQNNTPQEFLGTCLWDFGDGTTSSDCGDQFHTYNYSGAYRVTVSVTSNENCNATSDLGDFYARENPIALFDISPINPNAFFSEIQLSLKTDIPTTATWTIADTIIANGKNVLQSTKNLPILTEIPVKLFVETIHGCTDSAESIFIIEDVTTVYVPSAFTPNNDGINDMFGPVMTGIIVDDFHFTVFNRWGEMIFETDNPSEHWDGSYRNSEAKPDTYTWQLTYRSNNSLRKGRQSGTITLVR
jgi:gliding motility-associated-like protein